MTKDRKEYLRKYRIKHKARIRVYKSIWRNKNRKKIREYDKRYAARQKVGKQSSVVNK